MTPIDALRAEAEKEFAAWLVDSVVAFAQKHAVEVGRVERLNGRLDSIAAIAPVIQNVGGLGLRERLLELATDATEQIAALEKGETTKWVCENPDCQAVYAEYINGCPKCYHGHKVPLYFSVRAARAALEGK